MRSSFAVVTQLARQGGRFPLRRYASGWTPTAVQLVTLPQPFKTLYGGEIPEVTVKVEQHGPAALPPERTVLICPSFSHSAHVASNVDDRSPGWWESIVGPHKAIDTTKFRVICASVLGSPYSPTNPTATNPATGKPWRTAFPTLSPTDLANCHAQVLRQLGIDFSQRSPLHAVVGSSMGGMQSLQFASLFPNAVSRVVSIAATGRTTPFSVGIRSLQRKAILSDPHYHAGNYADHGVIPSKGLQLAREIGTLFYRSREEFDTRFDWDPSLTQQSQSQHHHHGSDGGAGGSGAGAHGGVSGIHWTRPSWEVESYLSYQGHRFIRSYDPNCYLLLSKCMDLMSLGDGFDGRITYAHGAARIKAEALLIGTKQDALIPAEELHSLAELINSQGRPDSQRLASTLHNKQATYVELSSLYGHDAFLKETAMLEPHLRNFLECGIRAELEREAIHNTGLNLP